MRAPMTRLLVFLYLLAGVAQQAVAQADQQRAQEYFKEARALCERDGGRLWGVSVCAPMVIADRRTGMIATSQPAPDEARPRSRLRRAADYATAAAWRGAAGHRRRPAGRRSAA